MIGTWTYWNVVILILTIIDLAAFHVLGHEYQTMSQVMCINESHSLHCSEPPDEWLKLKSDPINGWDYIYGHSKIIPKYASFVCVNGSELTINEVNLTHAGRYRCQKLTPVAKTITQFNVSVAGCQTPTTSTPDNGTDVPTSVIVPVLCVIGVGAVIIIVILLYYRFQKRKFPFHRPPQPQLNEGEGDHLTDESRNMSQVEQTTSVNNTTSVHSVAQQSPELEETDQLYKNAKDVLCGVIKERDTLKLEIAKLRAPSNVASASDTATLNAQQHTSTRTTSMPSAASSILSLRSDIETAAEQVEQYSELDASENDNMQLSIRYEQLLRDYEVLEQKYKTVTGEKIEALRQVNELKEEVDKAIAERNALHDRLHQIQNAAAVQEREPNENHSTVRETPVYSGDTDKLNVPDQPGRMTDVVEAEQGGRCEDDTDAGMRIGV